MALEFLMTNLIYDERLCIYRSHIFEINQASGASQKKLGIMCASGARQSILRTIRASGARLSAILGNNHSIGGRLFPYIHASGASLVAILHAPERPKGYWDICARAERVNRYW